VAHGCELVVASASEPLWVIVDPQAGLGYNISNLNGSKRLLSATAAFRNEPF